MSLIEEMHQDSNGNWTPEAEAILDKATVAIATNKGTHTLLPLDKLEDFFTELCDECAKNDDED